MIKKFKYLLLIAFVSFVSFSCSYNNVYDVSNVIKQGKWDSKNVLTFEYTCEDTLSVCNTFINIRHSGAYKYNNLYLFVTTSAPNGMVHLDTLDFSLADDRGKWKGSGIGDMHDVRLAYKQNIKFGQNGKYIFQIQQAMRDVVLEGITDVGFRIEKAN
jgi:gliding motility-associated lipoprotein GldH